MKKITFLAVIFCLFGLVNIANAQIVNIPDANFKAALVGNSSINTNGDGEIQVSEATTFNGAINVSNKYIADLTGIEAFTALDSLNFFNNSLTSLDISANTALIYLNTTSNQLTSLDVSAITDLTYLYCGGNQLTSLDVSANTALALFVYDSNQLTTLNVSANTALTYLSGGDNLLTSLDVSANIALTYFRCWGNQLTSLDVSSNTALTYLDCAGNQLTSLDVSSNTALTGLECTGNQLISLNVSANTALTYLRCEGNQLTSLDVSANTALTDLYCGSNQLTSLNVKNGNNNNMHFYANSNPNLSCINVDNATWSTTNWTGIDAGAYFSENCYSGISTLINTTEIKTYPNPTTGKLAVSLSNANISTIEIFNLIGEKIYAQNVNQEKSIEIDISNTSGGIYFLKVSDGVKVYTSKIVLQ